MRHTAFIFGVLCLMVFLIKTASITGPKSAFRQGVECSVYWQKDKCGPHTRSQR
jgi:hypothetical protein